jgi:4-amino-4-deoxy-L-arabinose transferase-like glycosyltransferase
VGKVYIIILLLLAAVKLGLHVGVNAFSAYEYFTDEYYYLLCGERLAFGYVDIPPLIAPVSQIMRLVLGDSLVAVRFLPALAGAAMIILVGLAAHEMGGKTWAVAIAGVAVFTAPIHWSVNGFLTTIGYDHFFWALTGYLVVKLLKSGDPRWWLAIGTALGFGMLNKHNAGFLAVAIVVGVLISNRQYLRGRWFWLGVGLATLLVTPNIIWQFQNNFATVEFLATAPARIDTNLLEFLLSVTLTLNPLNTMIAIFGLIYAGFAKIMQPYRLLVWTYLVPLTILMVVGGPRVDYFTPAYLTLFAVGGVAVERTLAHRPILKWVQAVSIVLMLVGTAVAIPLAIPLLPPAQLEAYSKAFGVNNMYAENEEQLAIPYFFTFTVGWREMAASVADVYRKLPPDERAKTLIYADGLGEPSALNFYRQEFGLPSTASGKTNFYLWGYGNNSAEITIFVGDKDRINLQFIGQFYNQVEQVGTTPFCKYCTKDRSEMPIYVAQGLKAPISEWWSKMKVYK